MLRCWLSVIEVRRNAGNMGIVVVVWRHPCGIIIIVVVQREGRTEWEQKAPLHKPIKFHFCNLCHGDIMMTTTLIFQWHIALSGIQSCPFYNNAIAAETSVALRDSSRTTFRYRIDLQQSSIIIDKPPIYRKVPPQHEPRQDRSVIVKEGSITGKSSHKWYASRVGRTNKHVSNWLTPHQGHNSSSLISNKSRGRHTLINVFVRIWAPIELDRFGGDIFFYYINIIIIINR